ncbi:MAG: hypothetical protein ACLFPX_02465 [Candidatus Omnitrophota bacterium]
MIFALAALIYIHGAFQYPWLEDDDPWSHAVSSKYVALEKNISPPSGTFHYLNPYPPGYAIIMGLLHQIHPSLHWVLKFFNGLIISLGFLFFYIMARELSRDQDKALLSTFFLLLAPCYLSHFIWAHALAVTLFFPAFYFLMKCLTDKKQIVPAAICCAAIPLVQPTQAIKFAIMALLMLAAYAISYRGRGAWKNVIAAILGGILIAALWWGSVAMDMLAGKSEVITRKDTVYAAAAPTGTVAKNIFAASGGTATEAYTLADYITFPKYNWINNPKGLGFFFSFLALLGLIYTCIRIFRTSQPHQRYYFSTIIFWLVFTFLGMNSKTFNLPIGLFAFRFWMLFAIPASFLAAEGIFILLKKLRHPLIAPAITLMFILIVTFQSGKYKYQFNHSQWTYGVYWNSDREMDGYLWLREYLPANTKVFMFTDNQLVIGMDMRADVWSQDYRLAFAHAFHDDLEHLHHNLIRQGFSYILVTRRDAQRFGPEPVNEKLENMDRHPGFERILSNRESFIFRVLP